MKQKGKRSSASVRKARPATRRTPRTRKPAIAPVPAQARVATPYLMVNDAARALEFYRTAFDAVEVVRLTAPEGRVAHAEIRIGDSTIFVSDEWPGVGVSSPQSLGGSPVVIHLEVEDVDAVARQAIAAGATVIFPVEDQFYGARAGRVKDPFGHMWLLSMDLKDNPRGK